MATCCALRWSARARSTRSLRRRKSSARGTPRASTSELAAILIGAATRCCNYGFAATVVKGGGAEGVAQGARSTHPPVSLLPFVLAVRRWRLLHLLGPAHFPSRLQSQALGEVGGTGAAHAEPAAAGPHVCTRLSLSQPSSLSRSYERSEQFVGRALRLPHKVDPAHPLLPPPPPLIHAATNGRSSLWGAPCGCRTRWTPTPSRPPSRMAC